MAKASAVRPYLLDFMSSPFFSEFLRFVKSFSFFQKRGLFVSFYAVVKVRVFLFFLERFMASQN